MDPMIDMLAVPPSVTPAGKSRMDAWLDTLTPERREAVLAAAVNRQWGHAALMEALREYGAPEMADTSFGSWRRKKGLPRVS
jgi:mono/diheme cytochrome c family protein